MRFRLFLITLLLCGLYGFGCGGTFSDLVPEPDITDIEPKDSVEELILSHLYGGELVVMLESSDGSSLEELGFSYRRMIGDDTDRYYERKEELERRSGRELPDLGKYHFLEIKNPRKAIDAYRRLKNRRGVELVYAREIPQLLGIETTPDLSAYQGYLEPYDTHGGVNAGYAWLQGIKGQGVILVDGEEDWDFNHQDVTYDYTLWSSDGFWDDPNCADLLCLEAMNHGTAVAGVIAGKHQEDDLKGIREYGIKGIAPGVQFHATDSIGPYYLMNNFDLPPGSIFIVELGLSCYGNEACLPLEVQKDVFDSIKSATDAGLTVISGAGNGNKDLSNSSVYPSGPYIVDLSMNDDQHNSGSIIVAGSQGAGAHTRLFVSSSIGSNYGTRDDSGWSPVDLFAWGGSVVTAGYGYPGNPYKWENVSGWNTPPNSDPHAYFINNFGGTSSATAIVGGAAALLQSYAKREMEYSETRYLRSSAIKTLLYNSGHPQSGGAGEYIGRQPDMKDAFDAFDVYWSDIKNNYRPMNPEHGGRLSGQQASNLQDAGVGIICKSSKLSDPANVLESDPACPDSWIWPFGKDVDGNDLGYRAKELDFDGDGRADLVQWTNGTLKLDLSSMADGEYAYGSGEDNFGAWDLELEYDPVPGRWAVSHVEDINKDGRADLVIYAREVGKWYVYYTDLAMIEDGIIEPNPENWDLVLDYSGEWHDDRTMDPFGTDEEIPDTRYSRPHIADYNGDGYVDIGAACSDGYWRIDYATGAGEGYGSYDSELRYLLPEQLELAPGWAYLTETAVIDSGSKINHLVFKYPDGVGNDGKVSMFILSQLEANKGNPDFVPSDYMSTTPAVFGESDQILVEGSYTGVSRYNDRSGIKESNGTWNYANRIKPCTTVCSNDFAILDIPPNGEFGGFECLPVLADFDGNGVRDRAVMCPDEWRIAYYEPTNFMDQISPDGMRYVELGYDEGVTSVPGISHAGGRRYSQVKSMIKMYQLHSSDTPPIPVDVYLK